MNFYWCMNPPHYIHINRWNTKSFGIDMLFFLLFLSFIHILLTCITIKQLLIYFIISLSIQVNLCRISLTSEAQLILYYDARFLDHQCPRELDSLCLLYYADWHWSHIDNSWKAELPISGSDIDAMSLLQWFKDHEAHPKNDKWLTNRQQF